jgi:Zn-dependent peptidase ImmA (M78 family)
LPRSTLGSDPEKAASEARRWLAIGDAEQESWKDDRAALRAWRDNLDERGILVFALEIGRDDVRGFSAWDNHAPLIVYNLTGVTPAARLFTIAHELGHLITRLDSACVEPREGELLGADVERWCEQFGSAFLMPRNAVANFATERQIATGSADLDDVRATSRRFRVSARAAALRLINLGYGEKRLYAEVERVFTPAPLATSENQKIVRPRRAVSRVREYGPRTLRAVLNNLPPRDAIAALRITVDDVREIANEVPGVRSF